MVKLVDIIPNYYYGFTFKWEVDYKCQHLFPWKFIVQESVNNTNIWENISDELINVFSYQEKARRHYPKDQIIKFRVLFIADNKTYISNEVSPYVKLNKKEFLIARDIMRKELLAMKKLSGVRINLYTKNPFAKLPDNFIDPITGMVTDPDSETEYCYSGPYEMFGLFMPSKKVRDLAQNGVGVLDYYTTQIRVIGYPYINIKDVIFDTSSGAGYYVHSIENAVEIKKFPVVQHLIVNSIPTGEHIYKLLKQ